MATSVTKKRRYHDSYIEHSFTPIYKGEEKPQCVLCGDILLVEAMKPIKIKRHLTSCHPEDVSKSGEYFKYKAQTMKRMRLDSEGQFQSQSKAPIMVSGFNPGVLGAPRGAYLIPWIIYD